MNFEPFIPTHILVFLALVGTVLAGWVSWRSSAGVAPVRRWLMVALRSVAVLAIVAVAANPGNWSTEEEASEKHWAVLVDTSASMATPDVDGKPRLAAAEELVQEALALSDQPERAKFYSFDTSLAAGETPEFGVAAGDGTDVFAAGDRLLDREGDNLSGVLLISDGRLPEGTKETAFPVRARGRDCPVYAVALGGEVRPKNLTLSAARRHFVAFPGQVVRLPVTASAARLGDLSVRLTAGGVEGFSGEQSLPLADGGSADAVFEVTAPESGYHEVVVETPVWEGESTAGDNRVTFGLTVIDTETKVLMLEGVPYWDSKFLAQLMRGQTGVSVTSVYRISEERFFLVETDLDRAEESREAVFPDSAEALAAYDLVVFGKGAEYFITPERAALLQGFVADQGGAVLFARGKPYADALPALEPIEPVVWGRKLDAGFSFEPTADGADVGLFGQMLPGVGDRLWKGLPAVGDAHQVVRARSFARVLAEGQGQRMEFPALITRRFGKGMVTTVNADGLWRWDFFPADERSANMYDSFWTQLMLWAVTYSEFLPGQDYSLRLAAASVLPGTPVRATVLRRSSATGTATPALEVVPAGGGKPRALAMAPVPGVEGRFEAVLRPSEPGRYRVRVVAEGTGETGATAALAVRPPPGESDEMSADPSLLARLAERSGGGLVAPGGLADAVAAISPTARKTALSSAVWVPAWDRWWAFAIALLFFAGEWILRRRNGLV